MLLARILSSAFRWGELTIIDAHGNRHRFTGEAGLTSTIRLHDPRLHRRLAISPDLAFGEAYVDGTLTIEEGDLIDFLAIAVANKYSLDQHWSQRLKKSAKKVVQKSGPVQLHVSSPAKRRPSL